MHGYYSNRCHTPYPYLSCPPMQSIVIGPGGRTIQSITEEAQREVEQVLGKTVDLALHVRHGKEK